MCFERNAVHFFDVATFKSGPNVVYFYHFDFEMRFAPQRRALFRCRNCQKWSEQTPCTFSISQLPQVVRPWCALNILTSKCASRQESRALFEQLNSTSKRVSAIVCFAHLHFEMCFAPQRLAPFQHLNFQKCSGPEMFCTFYLEICSAPQRGALFEHLNFQKWSHHVVLTWQCASRQWVACSFPTSQLPKVLRQWGVFGIFTLKSAARHNGVQFFISHLTTPEPQNIGTKTQCFATFLPFQFSHTCIYFLLTDSDSFSCHVWSSFLFLSLLSFSSLIFFFFLSLLWLFPPLLFHLFMLSDVWLLNFLQL